VSLGFLDLDPGPPLGRFGLDCWAGSEASRLLLKDILDAVGEGLTSGVEIVGDADSTGGLLTGPFNRSLIFKGGGMLNVLNGVIQSGNVKARGDFFILFYFKRQQVKIFSS
jgi:hypothetical protein